MKRYTLLILLMVSFLGCFAQGIAVKSFKPLTYDGTASSLSGKRIDQNGEVAALIKVVTTQTDFTFEGGRLGIVDTKQEKGEIWVWVPRASRKITIKHAELGVLRDYMFPVEIEAERTYEMVLTTDEVVTIIKNRVRQQYLAFQITPANAILEVNDELWSVDAQGSAMKFVDFGTYTYRVRASDYFTEAGKVTVNDPNNAQVVTVTLKPNFATITLSVDAPAEIWVNNEKKGIQSWTGPMGKGTYHIQCKMANHETTSLSKEITPEMNGQTITLPVPKPIVGSLNVESNPNFAKLYIDGKDMGTTPKFISEIIIGRHDIKLTKEGYSDYTETVMLAKDERKQIVATLTEGVYDEEVFTANGVSFTMRLVEGGAYSMGAGVEQGTNVQDDEKPVHRVVLSDFYMGETEVTQELWKAVMGTNPSNKKGDKLPVDNVSWNQAKQFIQSLNQITGMQFRLPTEAEWEYAARGGKKSQQYRYAGSNKTEDVACFKKNSSRAQNVKSKWPNELGIYDMSGNMWEWCSDWNATDYYSKSQVHDPQGPSKGIYRILRGGSWHSEADNCRVSYRNCDDPNNSDKYTGFRLALTR